MKHWNEQVEMYLKTLSVRQSPPFTILDPPLNGELLFSTCSSLVKMVPRIPKNRSVKVLHP